MNLVNTSALVSTEWLGESAGGENLKIIDATWYLPFLKKDAEVEYTEAHIPGAVFFNIDKIADQDNPLPHMLPSASQFAFQVGQLGISNKDMIIIYDSNGGFSAAARVWWMFRVFGHQKVSILNGGLVKWLADGHSVDKESKLVTPCQYAAEFNRALVRSLDDLVSDLETNSEQLIDGRSAGRFQGIESEPRPNLPSGHIPNSLNLPVLELFDMSNNMIFRPTVNLQKIFSNAGVNFNRPIVTTCGSGVTAAALSFALFLLGYKDVPVYDGSWSEWGADSKTPKVVSK